WAYCSAKRLDLALDLWCTSDTIFDPASASSATPEGWNNNEDQARAAAECTLRLGANDALFPASYDAAEAGFYSGAPAVTVDALPNLGHAFNLHTASQVSWQHIAGWLASK